MGAWQPTSSIAETGHDGVPTVDWVGPQGAPLDFDLDVPDGDQTGTWTGQVRLTPDATAVIATFATITFGSAHADDDGNQVRTATLTVSTSALEAGKCYVYAVARDAGSGYEPVVEGTLSPSIAIVR